MTQGMDVLLKEERVFLPPKELSEKAYIKSMAEYEALYKRSVEDPEGFWAEIAEQNITWYKNGIKF